MSARRALLAVVAVLGFSAAPALAHTTTLSAHQRHLIHLRQTGQLTLSAHQRHLIHLRQTRPITLSAHERHVRHLIHLNQVARAAANSGLRTRQSLINTGGVGAPNVGVGGVGGVNTGFPIFATVP